MFGSAVVSTVALQITTPKVLATPLRAFNNVLPLWFSCRARRIPRELLLFAVACAAAVSSGCCIGAFWRVAHASERHAHAGASKATDNFHVADSVARKLAAVEVNGEGESSATGGTLFAMRKIRTYKGRRLPPDRPEEMFEPPEESKMCERWAVLTSIFDPSDAVRQLASVGDWCVVVVGDKNGESSPLIYTWVCF